MTLNRPGSAWVFNQAGNQRWTRLGIWNHIASGGNVDEAALKLGPSQDSGNQKSP